MQSKKVLTNLVWRFAERSGTQIIQFVVQIILARLLTPEDYGIIGLITVFIAIASTFADSGLGLALIQKKNADEKDFSTVFFFSIVFSIILYIILFACAPFIADFYENIALTDVIRVLGVTIIIGGMNSVQQAYVQRTMQFKRLFYSTIGGTIASAVIGIIMAYMGFGVWALVFQQISNQLFNTFILWFTLKWRPKLIFSIKRVGTLFSYGWKLLCSGIIDTVYNNIYSLIIGKFYSTSDLGYYNKGKNFPLLLARNTNSTIDGVMFPVLADAQDEKSRVKSMIRRSIVTSTFIMFPAMAGLAAISKSLILILLTEKWLPSVVFLQFSCFVYAFWCVHTANLQAIKAMGRSDIYLKLEIIKKIWGIAVLIVTVPMGLIPMMVGSCISTVVSLFINAYPNKKLINYSYIEQVKDMLPSFLLAIVMFVIVLSVQLLNLNMWLTIIIQIILGVVIYFGIAKLLKFECLDYVLNMLKVFRGDKK